VSPHPRTSFSDEWENPSSQYPGRLYRTVGRSELALVSQPLLAYGGKIERCVNPGEEDQMGRG
jgi:hypothetical protein